jgi:transposase-like protein
MVRKRTPARMKRLVAAWRASGETRAGFARRHQIPAWTFWYWCRKLSAESPVDADQPPPATFVPVRVTADADAPAIEVVFTSGERVHVRLDAPADLVRTVLTALRAPC